MGRMETGRILVDVPVRVLRSTQSVVVDCRIEWADFDRSQKSELALLEMSAQRSDIDWLRLSSEDPYSLEAVNTEEDLVGRAEILNELVVRTTGAAVGSSYIFGQKRVGKTSIVQTLKTRLMRTERADYLVVYLEGGEYVHPDAKQTLNNLGRRLCEEIQRADKRLEMLALPEFDGALTPLVGFLNTLNRIVPSYRVLFVLDEFDELPVGLYKRGSVADAFFLTLRSISGKPPFGFVLVGSEKMEFILSAQGDALNKFQAHRVDYFLKDTHWSDFTDLVRRPVRAWLEITDSALAEL